VGHSNEPGRVPLVNRPKTPFQLESSVLGTLERLVYRRDQIRHRVTLRAAQAANACSKRLFQRESEPIPTKLNCQQEAFIGKSIAVAISTRVTGDSAIKRSWFQSRCIENRTLQKWSLTRALMVPFVAAALILICAHSEPVAAEGNRAARSPLLSLASRQFDNLTPAERAVLEYVDVKNVRRSGDWAVCGISPEIQDPSNDPKNSSEWGHERDLRASLLRWLSVDSDASRWIDPGGLRILGARVTGALDLKDVHTSFPIVLPSISPV
jgi:hypothetical protein